MTRTKIAALIFPCVFASCQKTGPSVDLQPKIDWTDSITKYGQADLGLDLYLNQPDLNGRSCVNCHLSPTGLDLVFFGKSNPQAQDSIVIQRTVFDPQTGHGHLSVEDAYHIASYLRSVQLSAQVSPNDNGNVIPIPSGTSPENVWDGATSLTEAQINNWDFRNNISISFEFPKWFAGDETNSLAQDNTDFIPEIDLLSEKEGNVRTNFDAYLADPSNANFLSLMQASHFALSEGERHPGEHNYYDFTKSFDYQRWMATLYFQHVIDQGNNFDFGDELSQDVSSFSIADALWDAGNVARRSQDNGNGMQEIDNRLQNELGWLYLGWLTNYGERNSFESQYIGTALKDYGEDHLATLVILKSIVSRSDHSQLIYDDLFSLSYLSKNECLAEALRFACNHIIIGLNNNNPRFELLHDDQKSVTLNNLGYTKQNITINSYLSATQKQELIPLVDSIGVFVSNM